MPQPMQNLKGNLDPTTTMNKALALIAKAFKLNTIPTNNNQRSSLIPHNSQIAQPDMNTSQDIKIKMVDDNVGNQVRQNAMQNDGNEVRKNTVQNLAPTEGNGKGINDNPIKCYNCRGNSHYASDFIVKPRKWDAAYLQQQFQIALEEEAWIQSTQEEFEFMVAVDAYEETKSKNGSTKVFEQKGISKGTRTNTKFTKQSILGKPPSSSFKPKLYSVTPFPKSSVLPKVNKTNALSKPVTSNSAPSTRESKVVQTVNVIAPRVFRTNPSKTSRVDNIVPNKPVKTSVRPKPITVSQPHVITKNDLNSKTISFSPKDVKNTTKTRRPQPRNNPKNDKVPSKSKSNQLSNNLEKIEENHKNLHSSSNKKHMSSECNNIKLAIRNAKSKVLV
nr:hypothetical protein [Tanacetum cinerariifolium]